MLLKYEDDKYKFIITVDAFVYLEKKLTMGKARPCIES